MSSEPSREEIDRLRGLARAAWARTPVLFRKLGAPAGRDGGSAQPCSTPLGGVGRRVRARGAAGAAAADLGLGVAAQLLATAEHHDAAANPDARSAC